MKNKVEKQKGKTLKLLKILFLTLVVLITSIAIAADTDAKKSKTLDKPSSQRIQYLDNYTQTLKDEVIQLGRFLSDLAWVGSVPTPNKKRATESRETKNALSSDLLVLGHALTQLEDGLLSPPGVQLVLFLSINVSDDFVLREVELSVNDKKVQSRKYTKQEVQSLRQGGAHQLYISNLSQGKHTITANYIGSAGTKNEYKGKKTFKFEKTSARKTIELQLSSFIGAPTFTVKEWD